MSTPRSHAKLCPLRCQLSGAHFQPQPTPPRPKLSTLPSLARRSPLRTSTARLGPLLPARPHSLPGCCPLLLPRTIADVAAVWRQSSLDRAPPPCSPSSNCCLQSEPSTAERREPTRGECSHSSRRSRQAVERETRRKTYSAQGMRIELRSVWPSCSSATARPARPSVTRCTRGTTSGSTRPLLTATAGHSGAE